MSKLRIQAPIYFPALEDEPRPAVSTAALSFYTDITEKTWRSHAANGTGPLQPVRILGQLRWRTNDIRQMLGVPRISQEAVAAYGVGYLHGRQGVEPMHPVEQEDVVSPAPPSPVVLTVENPDDYLGERWVAREGVATTPAPQHGQPLEGGAA